MTHSRILEIALEHLSRSRKMLQRDLLGANFRFESFHIAKNELSEADILTILAIFMNRCCTELVPT